MQIHLHGACVGVAIVEYAGAVEIFAPCLKEIS
jgi:hypothetical protein